MLSILIPEYRCHERLHKALIIFPKQKHYKKDVTVNSSIGYNWSDLGVRFLLYTVENMLGFYTLVTFMADDVIIRLKWKNPSHSSSDINHQTSAAYKNITSLLWYSQCLSFSCPHSDQAHRWRNECILPVRNAKIRATSKSDPRSTSLQSS